MCSILFGTIILLAVSYFWHSHFWPYCILVWNISELPFWHYLHFGFGAWPQPWINGQEWFKYSLHGRLQLSCAVKRHYLNFRYLFKHSQFRSLWRECQIIWKSFHINKKLFYLACLWNQGKSVERHSISMAPLLQI